MGTMMFNGKVVGNIPMNFLQQEQADWNQTDDTAPDYIKNKPSIDPVIDDINAIAKFELTNTNVAWVEYGNAYPSGTALIDNKSYRCYYLVAQKEFVVWADDDLYTESNDMWMCLYASTDFSDGTQQLLRTRQRKDAIDGNITTNTVPNADAKWTIKPGQVLLISIFWPQTSATVPPFRINVSGLTGLPLTFNENVALNGKQLGQVEELLEPVKEQFAQKSAEIEAGLESLRNEVDGIKDAATQEKTCLLQYKVRDLEQHRATEALFVYLPSKVGYVRYDFYHSVRESMNADNWRLNNCSAVDDALTTRFALTAGGEWECAIRLVDRDDFSAGIAHGDEIVDEVIFFVDGVETDITKFADFTEFSTLRIVECTRLFDPADHTTVIARHGREYQFTENGFILDQFVKWETSEHVDIAYLAMFTPAKTIGNVVITDKAYTDSNYETIDVSASDYSLVFPNAQKVAVWGNASGFYGSVEAMEHQKGLTGDEKVQILATSKTNYNKVYFYLTDDHTTTIGEVWRSRVKYVLEVGEGAEVT